MPWPSRPPLSRGRVIEVALALVEREGPKKLTMRRLGESLGVEAMSVYEYVTSKQDLISGIAGRLLSELRLDDAYTGPWLERIETVAREWARLAETHPRAFPLLYEPRQDTQKDVESSELILGALQAGGFDPPSAALAYRALTCLIDGALLRQTSALPGVNAAWHEAPEWFDPAKAPRSAEALEYGSRLQPAEIIDAGIRLMLAGLLEESRRRSSPGKA
jgi:AcrR family transcriptional regulator